ncbi:hypothetical protein BGX31_004112, partial [Mortierella sp. GBA43]
MAILDIFCVIEGETKSFSVKVPSNGTVDGLKDAIKAKKSNYFEKIDADDLTLWRVEIPTASPKPFIMVEDKTKVKSADRSEYPTTQLDETARISRLFGAELPEETIHVFIQPPPSAEQASTPLQPEEWRQLIAQIEDAFFAPGSENYTSLVRFVKGGANIPTTEGALGGLPFVHPRAGGKANRPSLLFLNLPESVESQDPP